MKRFNLNCDTNILIQPNEWKSTAVSLDFHGRKLIYDSLQKFCPIAGHKLLSPTKDKRSSVRKSSRSFTFPDEQTDIKSEKDANDLYPGGATVYTFGAGYHGQLGRKGKKVLQEKLSKIPKRIDFPFPVVQISCGGFYSAVISGDGELYTWGDSRFGQTGNLDRKHQLLQIPTVVDILRFNKISVKSISCGSTFCFILSSVHTIWCWGNNKYGQLGIGNRMDQRYPIELKLESKYGNAIQINCGDRHTGILTENHRILMFGSNQHKQLGFNNNSESLMDVIKPRILLSLSEERIEEIKCGATFSGAITNDGRVYIWGFGESLYPKHMLNVSDIPWQLKFKEYGIKIINISCGQSHILLLTDIGDLYSFGSGRFGQLGTGKQCDIRIPRLILKNKRIDKICCGRYHSICLSRFGVCYSWGCGENGQLGHNNLNNEYFPKIIESLFTCIVGDINMGEHHSICLSSQHFALSTELKKWKYLENKEYEYKKYLIKNNKRSTGLTTKDIIKITNKLRFEWQNEWENEQERIHNIQQKNAEKRLKQIQDPNTIKSQIQSQNTSPIKVFRTNRKISFESNTKVNNIKKKRLSRSQSFCSNDNTPTSIKSFCSNDNTEEININWIKKSKTKKLKRPRSSSSFIRTRKKKNYNNRPVSAPSLSLKQKQSNPMTNQLSLMTRSNSMLSMIKKTVSFENSLLYIDPKQTIHFMQLRKYV
eukprot:147796_1